MLTSSRNNRQMRLRSNLNRKKRANINSSQNSDLSTISFCVQQPPDKIGFLTIVEKLVWGTFNCLNDHSLSFADLQTYNSTHQTKINEIGILHQLYLHDIVRYSKILTKKYIYSKIDSVMNNPFISQAVKQQYFDVFSLTQKHYISLCKFAFICKFKKAKIGCERDMYLNPIEKKGSNYIELLHENRKYVFTIPDITKIIRKSLNTSSDMYIDPQSIKNPYDNLPFSKSNLYAIYFAIKKSDYNIPNIFQQYFYSNFSLTRLSDDYEPSMRETAIRGSWIGTDDECLCELKENIFDMIEVYNDTHDDCQVNIHNNFPEKVLIETFKPFMKYYYRSLYSLNNSEKSRSRIYWLASMKKFATENPTFGRKMIRKQIFGMNKEEYYVTNIISRISPYNYNFDDDKSHIELVDKEKDFVISYRINIKKASENRQTRTRPNDPNIRNFTVAYRDDLNNSMQNRNISFANIMSVYSTISQNNYNQITTATNQTDSTNTSSDDDDTIGWIQNETNVNIDNDHNAQIFQGLDLTTEYDDDDDDLDDPETESIS